MSGFGPTQARGGETSVHRAFENTRGRCGARPFLHIPAHCAGGLVDLTYEEAGAAVERTVSGYREAGYGQGHHIALLLDNRAEFYIHWLALNAIGAVAVPIGAGLTGQEAGYLLQHGDVDLLVHLPEFEAAAERAVHSIEGLSRRTTPKTIDAGCAPRAAPPRNEGSPAEAAIIFTSGSTGRPKGCVLSNEYFLTFGRWYQELGGRCALRAGGERLITPLPLNHVNALAFSSMGMILSGGCIIQLDRFRSSDWWPTVAASRATVTHYLGVMPAMLLQMPSHPDERSHTLRFGFGGVVRGSLHAAFEERFGFPLIEAWAMTETGGAGTISTHVGERNVGSGCIGLPSGSYAQARIVDEAGKTSAIDAVGELVVRATGSEPRRGFFSGYYKDPVATEQAWDGGWLHTGDLARRGADGALFFVGRRKQMIRRSGENISAAEVESVLGADPRIKEVVVVPVSDEVREEEVFAFVVANTGVVPAGAAGHDILRAAAERLAYYKLPGYIAFVDSLPVTATQKPRYGELAQLAQSLMAGPNHCLLDVRQAKRSYGPARR
jgi:acyl-CoA synthetase (AMP-forming)/AMP-acid ligase II